MPDLRLCDSLPDDWPILWRWLHAEPDPEWKRWDAPYFHAAAPGPTGPLPYADFAAREAGRVPSPHRRIIALDGTCIGQVTRWEEEPAGGGWWELGLVLYDPVHWGGGLGREVLRLWTAHTFADTAAHVLTLTTWGGNSRMIRAAGRVGCQECARIPQARLWQGQRWDSVKLARLRADSTPGDGA
jgi:RimJ/RimL family protein N-acetyltransferase